MSTTRTGPSPTGPAPAAAPRERISTSAHSTKALVAGLGVALLLLGFMCVLSIAVGSRTIPLGTTWQLLWNDDGSDAATIIHDLRIPRTVLGVIVGVALGLAGVMMQAITRNPLADPGLLGVSSGAAAAVVVAMAFFGITTFTGYVWFAFAGAAFAAFAVFLLGATGREPTPERQVLAGVALNAVLGAFVYAMLVIRRDVFDQFRFWEAGSLSERDLNTAAQVLPFVLVGSVIAFVLARSLNALALGDETSRALGAHVWRTRAVGMLVVTVLCGAATAAIGPVIFVGLAVPVAVRLVTGPDNRWVLWYSAILAPALILAADVLGRVVVRPGELQVGIVTAFLGAPVFIALARRRRIGTT